MIGRRYNEGLHQAIEAKEGVKIAAESKTLATITFQNYFRMYKKLSGMTGTAKTEATEFTEIYGLNIVTVPTNRPVIRKDYPDAIYKTDQRQIQCRHQAGHGVPQERPAGPGGYCQRREERDCSPRCCRSTPATSTC